MANEFHTLKVSKVESITDDAVAVSFDVSSDLKDEFSFLPGQYITLRSTVAGEDLRRSYSVCVAPGEGLRVGIKHVPGGRFSSFAQNLKPGDKLAVMKPEGRFVCKPASSSSRDFLLIAAGSGITPVLSIIRTLLQEEPKSTVTLIYGNRTTGSIMFRTELEDLKDRFLERFHVFHILSREGQDVDLLSGRIDVGRINAFEQKGLIDPKAVNGIYLCGPAQMATQLSEHFKGLGVSKDKIHTELFEAPDDAGPIVVEKATIEVAERGVDVEVVLDGVTRQFALLDANDTVLQAAGKSGLDLPFSCAGGMCATCRCKVVEGEASMDRNFSLDQWELDAGFVLACQSRPKTERLVLDFDAA